jgi:hypothetical protein
MEFEIVDPYFRYIWTGGSYESERGGFSRPAAVGNHARDERLRPLCHQPVTVMGFGRSQGNRGRRARRLAARARCHRCSNQRDLFPAYAMVEAVLDASNAPVLAQCLFVSNSIYVYNNTGQPQPHRGVVASAEPSLCQFQARCRGRLAARRGNAADFRPVAGDGGAGAVGAAGNSCADEQDCHRAGQRGERHVQLEHGDCEPRSR